MLENGTKCMNQTTRNIGWVRFDTTLHERLIHVALFETSLLGVPDNFSFIWGNLTPQDSLGISSLVETLIRAVNSAPLLLVGNIGDLSKDTVRKLNISQKMCFANIDFSTIPVEDKSYDLSQNIIWIKSKPEKNSSEYSILGKICNSTNPFEPLKRSHQALIEAVNQPNIRELIKISGLKGSISLSFKTGRAGEESIDKPEPDSNTELTSLIWKILAAPTIPKIPKSDFSLMDWPNPLMPFQKDGVIALINMDRLLLSDDMGLGKTIQVVAALRILRKKDKIKTCLIVTPTSLLDQWRQELNQWAPELSGIVIRGNPKERSWQWRARSDIIFASYDIIRQDGRFLANIYGHTNPWDVVVLDEAQRIKNRNQTSTNIKKIHRLRSWALTGTPIENNEEDLASIMEFVDHVGTESSKQYRAGDILRIRHRELQLRRRKIDVLHDLPPKIETKLSIPLDLEQRKSYDKAEAEGIFFLKSLGSDVKIQHILELIIRLKQICNVDPRTGTSSKLQNISERLQTLTEQGHRALIFSQYKSLSSGVGAAASYLKDFNPITLTGDTPPDHRKNVINRFKTSKSHKALIISLKVGGIGLNLQEASYVFHLDRWWNPAVEKQAEDRSHRMGQKVKVNVIKYSCQGTIEERIDRILDEKRALFDELIDDVSLDLKSKLNRRELLELFGLG